MPTRILPFTALCAVIALPCAAQSLSPQDKLPALPDGKVWKLVWNDEFDGTRIDETKWERQEYQRRDGWWERRASPLDGEGHLLVYCFREGDRYLDGSLRTKGKFEHTYGYYVFRAQLQREVGHWSAFWLQSPSLGQPLGDPAAAGTEIDIFEYLRKDGDRDLVRSWASDIEDGTMRQAERSARSPAVAGPIALMPDAHFGLGATIGSVIPTESAIIPAAVGVDGGCGMVCLLYKSPRPRDS